MKDFDILENILFDILFGGLALLFCYFFWKLDNYIVKIYNIDKSTDISQSVIIFLLAILYGTYFYWEYMRT